MSGLPSNIDRSAFRRGEYVGYADGVWIVRASGDSIGGYVARHRENKHPHQRGRTLADLGAKLAAVAS